MLSQLCNKIFGGRSGYFLGFIASFGLVGLALVIQTKYTWNLARFVYHSAWYLWDWALFF